MAQTEPAIVSQGLTKRYDGFTAVDNLDLEIRQGEIFGLLGPNGAGKTTTILMILGLSEPTKGSVRVAGLDPTRQPLDVKTLVGYVPDNVGFYPDLSGRQNLEYTAKLNRIDPSSYRDHIQSLLEQVGLADAGEKPASTYSRGMRQRLGIADALVKNPRILILDEPTIGIDPEGLREILILIRNLKDEKSVTVLLSSHLLHQVQSICDRVGIFVKGKLVAQGPISQLAAASVDQSAVEVIAGNWEAAGKAIWAIEGVIDISREPDMWVVIAKSDVRAQIAKSFAERDIPLLHLKKREQGLDEIYSRYFEGVDDGREPAGAARD